MSDNVQNSEEIRCFLQGKKHIEVPFELKCDDFKYVCTNVLRLLPFKRLVLEANNAEQHVVIKLFTSNRKGKRELEKEKKGYELACAAGIAVPELLLTSDNVAGCLVIAYKYIEDNKSLEDNKSFSLRNEFDCSDRIEKLYCFLAKMHRYGIYQDDIHLGNILLKENEFYLIDLGSVICEQQGVELSDAKSLTNLAKLVAQFYPIEQDEIIQQIDVYFREREWQYNVEQRKHFQALLDKAWKKRKAQYLKKCFRSCTMTTYGYSFTHEFAFRTDFLSSISVDLIKNIEQLMVTGKVLKAGNSATVVQVIINGMPLVIKRYNIKSIGHFLRRCWRPSRAAVSWRNANLLEFIGLATPKPFGFIEKRIGWFRHTAYFISEFIESENIQSVYLRRQPASDEVEQIGNIFKLLKKNKISHGDMKASNFIINTVGKILIIDLDAMQEHTNHKLFQHAHKKDKSRFDKNWNDLEIKKIFAERGGEYLMF